MPRAEQDPQPLPSAGATPSPARTAPPDVLPPGTLESLQQAWTGCRAALKYGDRLSRLTRLGVISTVLTAITATTVFASISSDPSTTAKVVVGSVAVVSAALSAWQSWLSNELKSNDEAQKQIHELHRTIENDIAARATTPLTAAAVTGWDTMFNAIKNANHLVSDRRRRQALHELQTGDMRRFLVTAGIPVPADWAAVPSA